MARASDHCLRSARRTGPWARSLAALLSVEDVWGMTQLGLQGLSDRVDLWEFSPDAGVGSAYIVFVDRNFNDGVRLRRCRTGVALARA